MKHGQNRPLFGETWSKLFTFKKSEPIPIFSKNHFLGTLDVAKCGNEPNIP
jgi:hypothetical protein